MRAKASADPVCSWLRTENAGSGEAFGNPLDDSDYYPFGGERVAVSNSSNHYKFTGLERDSESGLDHTLFRQYSSIQGRWMTPDPAGLAAADSANPQSWNRYAYVLNNPVDFVDPLGLECDWNAEGPCDWATPVCFTGVCDSRPYPPTGPEPRDPRDPAPPVRKRTPSADQPNCPAVPQAPPGADIDSNIKIARWMKLVTYTAPLVSLYTFDKMVGNKKPWDYKQSGWTLTDTGQLGSSPFADFANFNFGATGAAWGIPLNILKRGAGYAQVKAGTSTPEWGHWYQGSPYGDDPADQAQISAGYGYYQHGCYKKK